jgi:hypothetical protein
MPITKVYVDASINTDIKVSLFSFSSEEAYNNYSQYSFPNLTWDEAMLQAFNDFVQAHNIQNAELVNESDN